jgi:hypothetical protein
MHQWKQPKANLVMLNTLKEVKNAIGTRPKPENKHPLREKTPLCPENAHTFFARYRMHAADQKTIKSMRVT